MVRYKLLALIYLVISSFTKDNIALSQWNGGLIDYGPYFVPCTQQAPGCNQYAPVQNTPNPNPPIQGPYPGPYLPPPIPNPPPNIYSNTPSISYQGYEDAMSLRDAHPNQPIIIINNGLGGGGNTDGKKNGIDLIELITVFLAAKAGSRGKGKGGGGENKAENIETPAAAPALPPAYYPPAYLPPLPTAPTSKNSEESGGISSINITIVLPNSDAEVLVEENKTKTKKKKKQKNNTIVVKEIDDDDD